LALPIAQTVGEPTPQLSLRASSNRATEPLDRWERWADDAPRAQFLEHSSYQRRSMVGCERRRQQPRRDFSIHGAS